MALTDITKGMSNASEAIDGNFKSATIVESESNEKGSYIRFGDGTQICTINEMVLNKLSSYTLAGGGSFPAAFKDSTIIINPIVVESSTVPIGRFVQRAVDEVGFSLWYENISSPFTGPTYTLKIKLVAIGRWK